MVIIWSGLGLLVIPAVLVGYMMGSGLAGVCGLDRFTTSAGCLGAFCLLWLLCAAIYPRKEQRQEFSTGGKILNLMGFQKKADGPSATLSPLFETLARSRKPGVCYGHVDYKHYPYVFRDYRIGIPEIWLYRDGKPLGRMRKVPSSEQLGPYIDKLLEKKSTAAVAR